MTPTAERRRRKTARHGIMLEKLNVSKSAIANASASEG
jgi:hypothetical protein